MDITSFIGGFNDVIDSLKSTSSSVTSFFTNVSVSFSYLPPAFWAIVLAALVLIVVLRILGR